MALTPETKPPSLTMRANPPRLATNGAVLYDLRKHKEGGAMDATHEAHLKRILDTFNADARKKYAKGQAEHGGNLWEQPGLLDFAIEEAIDMVVYLYTLKEQMMKRPESAQPCGCDKGAKWTCEAHR